MAVQGQAREALGSGDSRLCTALKAVLPRYHTKHAFTPVYQSLLITAPCHPHSTPLTHPPQCGCTQHQQ